MHGVAQRHSLLYLHLITTTHQFEQEQTLDVPDDIEGPRIDGGCIAVSGHREYTEDVSKGEGINQSNKYIVVEGVDTINTKCMKFHVQGNPRRRASLFLFFFIHQTGRPVYPSSWAPLPSS